MLEKLKAKRSIRRYQKLIKAVEQKRVRSQAALVEAILTNTTPNDSDVDYFNKYTAEIDSLRGEMHELQLKLEKL